MGNPIFESAAARKSRLKKERDTAYWERAEAENKEESDKLMATIEAIIRDVAELPDRSSPEGQPEMMLVTAAELRNILVINLGRG